MQAQRSRMSFIFLMSLGVVNIAIGTSVKAADPLDQYNVVWETPSKAEADCMPIGNGETGLNVWVEEDGDLLFYISRTDAWSENCRLLKLGRVRVKLTPNPFVKGMPFRQELGLRQGEIVITAGQGDKAVTLRVWVDANNSVVHVDADIRIPCFSVRLAALSGAGGLSAWTAEP